MPDKVYDVLVATIKEIKEAGALQEFVDYLATEAPELAQEFYETLAGQD